MENNRRAEQIRRFAEFCRSPRTEKHRRNISNALKGRSRPEIAESQTTSWKKIRPLVIRNGTSSEISSLTEFTPLQVSRMISQPRTVFALPEYKSEPYIKEREKKRKRKASRGLEAQQVHMTNFAKSLYERGFIDENAIFWHLSKTIAKAAKSPWFDDLSTGLVVEGYVVACFQESRGKSDLMRVYNLLGKRYDEEWFNSKSMVNMRRRIDKSFAEVMLLSK